MDPNDAILVGALLGATVGAAATAAGTGWMSYWLTQKQIKIERKNIANALFNEIEQSETGINNFNTLGEGKVDSQLGMILIPNKLSYSNEVYYVNEKQIASFNKNLVNYLYRYHRDLTGAEECRVATINFVEKRDSSPNKTEQQKYLINFYNEGAQANSLSMVYCMKDAAQLIPKIKKELQKEIND
jgi:hypothetical protein